MVRNICRPARRISHFLIESVFFHIFLYIFPIHYISFSLSAVFHISIAPLYIKIYNNLGKWQVKFEYGIYNFPEKALYFGYKLRLYKNHM